MNIYGQRKILKEINRLQNDTPFFLFRDKPLVFVSDLKAGEGVSTIVQYISSTLYNNKMIKVEGDLNILEYIVDGSLKQLEDMIDDIDDCAVYTNYFSGVVCIDLEALQDYYDEYQTSYIISYINRRAKYTTYIVLAASRNSKDNRLLKRLLDEINGAIYLESTGYSEIECAAIIMENIRRNNIKINNEKELENYIVQEIQQRNLEGLKTIRDHFEYLYKCLEYKNDTYSLNMELVKNYIE